MCLSVCLSVRPSVRPLIFISQTTKQILALARTGSGSKMLYVRYTSEFTYRTWISHHRVIRIKCT